MFRRKEGGPWASYRWEGDLEEAQVPGCACVLPSTRKPRLEQPSFWGKVCWSALTKGGPVRIAEKIYTVAYNETNR